MMSVDSNAFRAVLGRVTTSVAIVTTCLGKQRAGMTVNAYCSTSLDPPLVLVCIRRTAYLHTLVSQSGIFAINILALEQQALAECFARGSEHRYREFCGARTRIVKTGAPVLEGVLGFLDCRVQDVFPGGDHSIFVGQVEALQAHETKPLLYYGGSYTDLERRFAEPLFPPPTVHCPCEE